PRVWRGPRRGAGAVCGGGGPLGAGRGGAGERWVKGARRRPAVAALIGTVAFLLLAVAVGSAVAAAWFRGVAADAEQARGQAVAALGREETERRAAQQARQNEAVERRRAEGPAETNRLRLYAAHIGLAQQAWEPGDL